LKNYRKHIDTFFREKLGSYSETPPPEVWDDLEKRLDGLTTGAPTAPYRWLWHVAIISVLLFLGVSVARKTANKATNTDLAMNSKSASAAGSTPTTPNTNQNSNITSSKIRSAANENATAKNDGPGAMNKAETTNNNMPGNDEKATNGIASSSTGSNRKNTSGQRTVANKQHPASSKTTGQPIASGNNTYNSKPANTSAKHGPAADESSDNSHAAPVTPNAAAEDKNTIPPAAAAATQKKQQLVNAKTNVAEKATAKHSPIGFNRFEAGVKVGYEGGYTDGAASKAVISPYLQYNMSSKFALMVQPAVKAANVSGKSIGSNQSYYSIVPESANLTENDAVTTSYIGGTLTDTHTTQYTYSQAHDSIVKSNAFRGTYAEIELPILLKYSVSKKVAVYGGVNLVYSKLMGVTENTYTKQNIVKTLDTTIVTVNHSLSAPTPPANLGVTYSGNPYSNYQEPAYPGTPQSQLRIGYMLGFTYNYSKKWMFDALVEQAPAGQDVKGGYNINTPLSSTYFRLSVGYKLTK